jgi:phthiocerol/phenolphthiocerol synthesis type-I polyketide synthase E
VALRTACSTSLVALHFAVRSLRAAECGLALAGGSFVNLEQNRGYEHQDGSFLSADGHCRPFDAGACGTVFGNGVGVVVLKRLADALADGDTVYAVVAGTAVNNDGAVKVGFTAPSVTGQTEVISAALADAGVGADTIGYVEAHGTGTVLGDPVEVQALTKAYRQSTDRVGYCGLGSVKSNIGHLDAAAGIAGLIKAVLGLYHRVLPPTVNFQRPNPDIDFAGSPFRVQDQRAAWPDPGYPRRAGVSAFGFGGTNAHAVLEQAPDPVAARPSARATQLLVLSARTPDELDQVAGQLAGALRHSTGPLADAAWTLAAGRRAFPFRRVLTAAGPDAAAQALESGDPAVVLSGHTTTDSPPLAFLYPGQGAQYPGMGQDLYHTEPVYRQAVDSCAELLAPHLGLDIRTVFGPGQPAGPLQATRLAQPALFTVEYALTMLWQSWGLQPMALLGHSVGEYTAATIAGVFTLADALRLIALRGQLMQAQPPGSMINVVADRDTITPLLAGGLALAAHNSPKDCVVSGPADEVAAFTQAAAEAGLITHPIATSHAFHSPVMDPITSEFTHAVSQTPLHPPAIPLISNTTGTWITAEQATSPGYWAQHALRTVEFAAGVAALAQTPHTTLLEVGPGQTLATLSRRNPAATGHLITASLPHPRDRRSGTETIQRTLGQLWSHGHPVNWTAYYQHEHPHRTPLPSYPFHHQTYWLHPHTPTTQPPPDTQVTGRHEGLADWFYLPSWERSAVRAVADGTVGRGHNWLVFLDELGLGRAIARRLQAAGATVCTVAAGPGWNQHAERDFSIDPETEEDYDKLLAAAAGGGPELTRLVHCWPAGALDRPEANDPQQALRLGFGSLLLLSRALGRRGDDTRRHLWVISNGVQNVTDREPLAPVKATLLGACRVIPREQSWLRCRSVDVVIGGPPDDRLIGQLLAEFGTAPGPEAVAYRGAHRWSQHFRHEPLDAAGMDAAGRTAIRPGRAYLVTGGLGGIGLALAKWITQAGGRAVLTSRTALPAQQEWADLMASGAAPGQASEAIRALSALQADGRDFMVAQADVCEPSQMRAVVDSTVERWGAISGVFHAAGVAGAGLIQVKDLDSIEPVIRPKVAGTLVLDQVLAGQPLDFMVLFGSNAANVGTVGQADYCAANCFLDAFAHASGSRRVISIDWGPWQQVGMSVSTDLPDRLRTLRQMDVAARGMTPDEGLAALGRVLTSVDEAQIVVSPVALPVLFENALVLPGNDTEQASRLAELQPADTAHPRPSLATRYVPPRTATERELGAVLQDLLGIEEIGMNDSLFDLGGDSLIAIQLASKVNQRWPDAALTIAHIYEALTVSRLAAHIDRPAQVTPESRDLLAEQRARVRKRREHQQRRIDKRQQ